jgi:hypothetical protein
MWLDVAVCSTVKNTNHITRQLHRFSLKIFTPLVDEVANEVLADFDTNTQELFSTLTTSIEQLDKNC